jgi:hypothetical protein
VRHEAVRFGIDRCESGERVLADLLARGTDGPPDRRAVTVRVAGIALLDNVRELHASLVRLDVALVPRA